MSDLVMCRELVEFLDEYLEGRLPGHRVAAFEAHLAICPSCVAYLNTYRQSVALGKAVLGRSQEPVPDEVPADLVRAILAARKISL